MKLTSRQLEKYNETVELLQDIWEGNFDDLKQLYHAFKQPKGGGIRSTQVGALVMLLIKLDIIK